MQRILTTLVTLFFTQQACAQCTCIYAEGTVKEGETACIWSEKGKTLARCEKVQNVTSWKLLDQPCPLNQSAIPTPENNSGEPRRIPSPLASYSAKGRTTWEAT
jgi:hypothetical protein